MIHILRQIVKTGIRTEPSPGPDDSMIVAARLQENILRALGRASFNQAAAIRTNAAPLPGALARVFANRP